MACPEPIRPQDEQPASVDDSQAGEAEIPIPQPPATLLLGHFPLMDPTFPIRPIQQLAELYGGIYSLQLGGRLIVVSSQELVNEFCDQDRFCKDINLALNELRALTGDGLFTAAHEDGAIHKREENWWKAHRLLVPSFGPLGLRKMFDDMVDLSAQMVLKWDRLGPTNIIDCADDFTRLTFDTIGLCGFGYRFNEFYSDDVHPFAKQLADVLKMSGRRSNRPGLINALHLWEERERQDNIKKMHDLCYEIVADRRERPQLDAKDALNCMLFNADRETGERLSDQNVVHNMVTFLGAGHETTSATLSFLWYNLLRNPEKLYKAQQEVDEVLGNKVITLDMIPKLQFLDACIKETLRLNSPIGLFTLGARKDTYVGNGRYKIKKSDTIQVNLKGLHHDYSVWGDNHDEFFPERFMNGGLQKLPPNSWKPYGNGLRACIGRGFAEQEMLICSAMMLQRFIPEMVDPSYNLKLKSTLTVKPEGFQIRVTRRPGRSPLIGIPGGMGGDTIQEPQGSSTVAARTTGSDAASATKVEILYGGNAGTCEGFAQILEGKLLGHGVQTTVSSLDSAAESLDDRALKVIITSSYEGKAPDNAKRFVAWLERLVDEGTSNLHGVEYALMGVGNSDWAATFHRIPKYIDQSLDDLGARRVVPCGYANVKDDLIGPFDDWMDALIRTLTGFKAHGRSEDKSSVKVTVENGRLTQQPAEQSIAMGTVLVNRELSDTSVGLAKKHMEIRLPGDMTYSAGDYLCVQPRNPIQAVHRVMRYFGFTAQTSICVEGSTKSYLLRDTTSVELFLLNNVELGTPVTKRQLKTISEHARDEDRQALEELQKDTTYASILEKRFTLMDILADHKLVSLPFEVYVDMLVPLTPRQYSISSSPLRPGNESVASITYDVHTADALSGHGTFEGVSSTFLASRQTGEHISCFVRSTNVGFRLPADPTTPVIMFAAGTGIAPMRAFLQERATIMEAGSRSLGPALLFYGCRNPEKDFLYKEELEHWQTLGIVQVFPAYSRVSPGGSSTPKYVHEAIWEQRHKCWDLFNHGGRVYLCGSAARLGRSCAEVWKRIYRELHDKSEADAEAWLDSTRTERFISDTY